MKNVSTFLLKLRNDVFKLLPMRELTDDGKENNIYSYIDSLIVTAEGATSTFEDLGEEKGYIYVINNLNYLKNKKDIEFGYYRKIILNSTRSLDDLRIKYGGASNNE